MPLPTLRSRLLLLAFASMVPILVLSLLMAWQLLQREEALARDGAMDRSRAIASAVDAKLEGHLAALRSLAAAQSLADGQLTDFLAAARRVQSSQPYWRNVLLIDATARQRLNLRLQRIDGLPHEADSERAALQQVLATGEPYIGGTGRGPLSAIVALPLQIRVQVAGEPMALKLILEPAAFASLLEAQRLPTTWAAAVIDGQHRFVARLPERPSGEPVAAGLHQALQAERSGWVRARTLEGMDAHQAFVHSSLSSWAVAVAIPRSEVLAGTRRAAGWLVGGTLVSLLLAGGLAVVMARRVAAPIHALARAAGSLGQGSEQAHGSLQALRARPGFAEAVTVVDALERAADSMHERDALQERERTALREADRAKDEFLAMLGHELRNPLSAIMASAHVLRLAQPDPDGSERAHQVIDRQTRQMTRLIEDLLDISRLVAGKLRLDRSPGDLLPLVQQAVQGWQQARAGDARPVHVNGTAVWADVDRARFEQILMNLLDNADKFSPAGSPIEVRLAHAPPWAMLTVRDHGRGIAPEALPRLFDTFYQAPQSIHRPEGGLGLGLSLVRRLCEHHGGQADAHSDGVGQGATFTVRLPAMPPAPASPPAPALVDQAGASGRRVLIVDDNDDGRAMLELLLHAMGHEVLTAANGAEALQLLAQASPEVALIDIGLPDIDGWEVARRAGTLTRRPAPRLIALSGFGQPEDHARSMAAGFALHLTKPVRPEQLQRALAGDDRVARPLSGPARAATLPTPGRPTPP